MLKIAITNLIKAGVFSAEGQAFVWRVGNIRLRATLNRKFQRIDFIIQPDDQENGKHFIDIKQVTLKYGPRWYFVCPINGSNCLTLYLGPRGFGSRSAYRLRNGLPGRDRFLQQRATLDRVRDQLLGRNGFRLAKGARRSRLLERHEYLTERYGDAGFEFFELDYELAKRRQRRLAPRVTRQRLTETSTKMALDWDAQSGEFRFPRSTSRIFELASECAGQRAGPPSLDPVGKDQPFLFIEDQPALDLRALAHRWDFRRLGLYGAFLSWPAEANGERSDYFVALDLRMPKPPVVLVRPITANGMGPCQTIEMAVSSNDIRRRWQMVCPVTGGGCDILYLRRGWFASAKAQRLVHRSQRKARPT